jgi:hypothetical protein
MKTKMNLLRELVGLPVKKRTRISRKKSSYRKTCITKIKKKQPTKFQQGLQAAQTITTSWNSQANPPKVYVSDRRIHHGEVGVLVGLVGICKNDPYLVGFGTGLALDDLHDANEWFTFKKQETLPNLSYGNNFA